MTELLPCPFCGGGGKLRSITPFPDGCLFYRVECTRCGVGADWRYTQNAATEAWNTRYKETTVYDREETIEGCTVQILTNSRTGETSVGWWRGSAEDKPKCESD